MNLKDEYLNNINIIKDKEYKVFGAFLNNNTHVGDIYLHNENDNYIIKNIKIIENQKNLINGLFNYIYSVARVNKIKNIIN